MSESWGHEVCMAVLDQLTKRLPYHYHIRVAVCTHYSVQKAAVIKSQDDYTLIFVISGKGGLTSAHGASGIALSDGKFAFFSPGVEIEIAVDKPRSSLSMLMIQFAFHRHADGDRALPDHESFLYVTLPGIVQKYRRYFQTVLQIYNRPPSHNRDMQLSSAVSQLVGEIYHTLEYRAQRRGYIDERIRYISQYLDQNPTLQLRIDKLAEEIGLSTKYFSTRFKQVIGLSPKAYHLRAKMQYAAMLLENTSMSIQDTALAVGYPDPYSFSKQFKNKMGYSPSAVRRRRKHLKGQDSDNSKAKGGLEQSLL